MDTPRDRPQRRSRAGDRPPRVPRTQRTSHGREAKMWLVPSHAVAVAVQRQRVGGRIRPQCCIYGHHDTWNTVLQDNGTGIYGGQHQGWRAVHETASSGPGLADIGGICVSIEVVVLHGEAQEGLEGL